MGQPRPRTAAEAAIQMVALHGNLSGDGRLSEVEILASTSSIFNKAAIERAGELLKNRAQPEPGGTPQSSEVLLTFEFVTAR